MRQKADQVRCLGRPCRWNGRRVHKECGCCEPCSHSGYGNCPHCGARVMPVSYVVQVRALQARMDA